MGLAVIDLAVEETNAAYKLSGINAKLRLVFTYREPKYEEDLFDPFRVGLTHITTVDDGVMDDVHEKRKKFGADVVVFIIHDVYYCGLAWQGPSKDKMFSVIRHGCATGYFSFGHEIAHNFDCNHDRGSLSLCNSGNYDFAYRDPQARFRTILAYNCLPGQCDNNPGTPCPRLQYFSNPSTTTHDGYPVGNVNNDNARRINEVKGIVASYYTSDLHKHNEQKKTTQTPATLKPSKDPSSNPNPSLRPSVKPTSDPTIGPSTHPSSKPSVKSSQTPSNKPSSTSGKLSKSLKKESPNKKATKNDKNKSSKKRSKYKN